MEQLIMKELKHFTRRLAVACGIILAGWMMTGCKSEPTFAEFPLAPVAGNNNRKPDYAPPVGGSDTLIIGDVITINFNSGDTQPLPQHQEAIKDDGRITPPYVGSVVAKGKSPGELQSELQKLYDKLYRNMTVTVSSRDRYYYVSGEVKNPGTKPYLGETDILKAISSASDFTDFAKKTKVQKNRRGTKM